MMASSPLTNHFGGRYGADAIFQPPKASPSTKVSPSVATGDYFSGGGARKRQRSDSTQVSDNHSHARHAPWTASPGYTRFPVSYDSLSTNTFGQASPLVNEQYRLAGGFDTPSLQAASLFEGLSVNDEYLSRGRMRDCSDVHAPNTPALLSGPLARERNGVARINTNPDGTVSPSWTSFAFNLVGKVFTFGGSMIRGFYAGGGKGYDLNGARVTPPNSAHETDDECATPIPGAWDFGEMLGTSEKEDSAFLTPSSTRPPNKRRQTDRDTWIMIGTPDLESTVLSPSRKPSNVSRGNMAGRTGASRANSRRSAAPLMSRNSPYVPVSTSPAHSQPPVPVFHDRRASVASVRSPHGRPSNTAASNGVMSPEAERYVRRQAKQDRAADKAMNSMSRRLEDLIKQGQEALGTKYSVEGDDCMDEDEGFVDEAY